MQVENLHTFCVRKEQDLSDGRSNSIDAEASLPH